MSEPVPEILPTPPLPVHILLRQLQYDQEIVQDDALRNLMYQFRGPFYRKAHRILASEDEAKSVMQDTFVKIFQYRFNYQERSCSCKIACAHMEDSACGYIWKIHERTVLDALERVTAVRKMISDALQDLMEYPAPEDGSSSPDAYVERKWRIEIAMRAWERLSDNERLILSSPAKRGPKYPTLEQTKKNARAHLRNEIHAILAEEEQA